MHSVVVSVPWDLSVSNEDRPLGRFGEFHCESQLVEAGAGTLHFKPD